MATETYKYFKPDTDLRAEFGGGAIAANGDSAETSPFTLTTRYICQQLGYPIGNTRFLFDVGVATDTFTWVRCPDILYSAISSYLSTAELASVVSSAPAGWAIASTRPLIQPHPKKFSFIMRGDSLPAGTSTTTGDTRDTVWGQALTALDGPISWFNTDYRDGLTPNYMIGNISLGSSSFGNTDSGGGIAVYPQREDLAFNQRTATLPINSTNVGFIYWMGTNDLAYDLTLSAADAWARVVTRMAAFRARFPLTRTAFITTIKRGTSSPLHVRQNDFNILARAGYLSAGFDVLGDIEANTPEFNIATGDTTDTDIYADTVHPTTLGHSKAIPTATATLLALAA